MSLQRKFAVLLAMLAAAVLASVGVALWTIDLLESLARPWAEIQEVQAGLNAIKRSGTNQVHLWSPGFPLISEPAAGAPAPREVFERESAAIERELARLAANGAFRFRVGASNAANLQGRIEQAQRLGRAWVDSPGEAAEREATRAYYDLHELIEAVERGLISHAYFEVDFGRAIRPRLIAVLAASLGDALLAFALGAVLIRRWVVRPARVLREAAMRLGQGDFSHRVPVEGRDELALLSAEVNHMAGMISTMQEERVDRERLAAVGEMVRRLAHNLRNPLAGIRSLAELTRADLPPDSPAIENQERIVTTVDRFERWLSELLSATTPLRVAAAPSPVASWLRAVAEPLRPLANERGVDLQVRVEAAPDIAEFDPRHLEQAVVAIVTNAIQASPRREAVTLSARACEDGKGWEIRCADRGPGVDAALREKIFRPYFTTKRDGTGIGLAVAKQVVEQHGGRIWVESPVSASTTKQGQPGAEFVVWLPRATGAGVKEPMANSGHIGAGGGKDPDRRRRGEPPVLDPADAAAGRARGDGGGVGP